MERSYQRSVYLDRTLTFVSTSAREMSEEELAWVFGDGEPAAAAIGDIVLRTLIIKVGTGATLVDKLQSGAELLGAIARKGRNDALETVRNFRISRYEMCPHCSSPNVERVGETAVRCQNCFRTREVLSA